MPERARIDKFDGKCSEKEIPGNGAGEKLCQRFSSGYGSCKVIDV
jgi:hypothetical protein